MSHNQYAPVQPQQAYYPQGGAPLMQFDDYSTDSTYSSINDRQAFAHIQEAGDINRFLNLEENRLIGGAPAAQQAPVHNAAAAHLTASQQLFEPKVEEKHEGDDAPLKNPLFFQPLQQPMLQSHIAGQYDQQQHAMRYDAEAQLRAKSMIEKTKRIQKREKAKNRKQQKLQQQQQQQQSEQHQTTTSPVQGAQTVPFVKHEEVSSNDEQAPQPAPRAHSHASPVPPVALSHAAGSATPPPCPSPRQDDQMSSEQRSTGQGEGASTKSGAFDPKQQKKMLQMIRNRISAQNSRDRKKQYITTLEARNSEIMQINFMLQKKVDELLAENTQFKNEATQLRNELNKIKAKFGGKQEDYFEDPQIAQQARPRTGGAGGGNYAALGLALFSLVSILMLVGSNVNAGSQSQVLLQQQQQAQADGYDLSVKSALDLTNQNQLEIAFTKIEKLTKEYEMLMEAYKAIEVGGQQLQSGDAQKMPPPPSPSQHLEKDIVAAAAQVAATQMQIEYPPAPVVAVQNTNTNANAIAWPSLPKAPTPVKASEKKKDFLPARSSDVIPAEREEECSTTSTSIAPANFHADASAHTVQTIFCPCPYKMMPEVQGVQDEQQRPEINFKSEDWVQLVLPKKDLRYVTTDVETNNIYVGRQAYSKQTHGEVVPDNSNKLIEVWAKVQFVREHVKQTLSAQPAM